MVRLSVFCVLAFLMTRTGVTAPIDSPCDHGGPETDAEKAPAVVPGVSPIVHGRYYRGERELFGYSPRFLPTGEVAFDLANRPFIRASQPAQEAGDGTTDGYIQTLGHNGRWLVFPIVPLLQRAFPNWGGRYVTGVRAYDTRIIADDAGDAYTLVRMLPPSARTTLLHLRADSDTWDVHQFAQPGAMRLESAGSGPPVVLRELGGRASLYALRKDAEGKLVVPEPIDVSPDNSFLNPSHSGAGSTATAVDGKTYVLFARGTRERDDRGELIPGTPQYVVTYDHETGRVSNPVLLGFGQNCYTEDPDVHNAGAIVADSEGILHAVLGAHQHHFWHVYSLKKHPSARSDWSEPEPLGLRRRYDCGYTYVALVIDKDDTLHCVGRNMSRGVTEHGKSLPPDEMNAQSMARTLDYLRATRRPNGGWEWEELGPLVVPPHRGYSIFYHKLTLDRRDRLFLTYSYYAAQLNEEMVAAYRAKWPEENLADPEDGKSYAVRPHDPVILMSDDGGDSWHIATTADFVRGLGP